MTFTISGIMDQDKINDLLERYRLGQCSAKEIQWVHLWYEGLKRQSEDELNDQQALETENRIFTEVQRKIAVSSGAAAQSRKSINWYWAPGIAASLLLILGLGIYLNQNRMLLSTSLFSMGNFKKQTAQLSFENTTSIDKDIRLEDGSIVRLAPYSKIIYPSQFTGNQRVVELSGNAFFQITENPKRPFVVHSRGLTARVLGTSFWVKSSVAEDTLTVEVVTGKVAVYQTHGISSQDDQQEGVVLTPNQKATFFTETGNLSTGLVERPKALGIAAVPVKQSFDHATLSDIVSVFHQKYGIEIILAGQNIAKCTFTGDVTGLQLFDALDLICESISANHHIDGTRIYITGNGCN